MLCLPFGIATFEYTFNGVTGNWRVSEKGGKADTQAYLYWVVSSRNLKGKEIYLEQRHQQGLFATCYVVQMRFAMVGVSIIISMVALYFCIGK